MKRGEKGAFWGGGDREKPLQPLQFGGVETPEWQRFVCAESVCPKGIQPQNDPERTHPKETLPPKDPPKGPHPNLGSLKHKTTQILHRGNTRMSPFWCPESVCPKGIQYQNDPNRTHPKEIPPPKDPSKGPHPNLGSLKHKTTQILHGGSTQTPPFWCPESVCPKGIQSQNDPKRTHPKETLPPKDPSKGPQPPKDPSKGLHPNLGSLKHKTTQILHGGSTQTSPFWCPESVCPKGIQPQNDPERTQPKEIPPPKDPSKGPQPPKDPSKEHNPNLGSLKHKTTQILHGGNTQTSPF